MSSLAVKAIEIVPLGVYNYSGFENTFVFLFVSYIYTHKKFVCFSLTEDNNTIFVVGSLQDHQRPGQDEILITHEAITERASVAAMPTAGLQQVSSIPGLPPMCLTPGSIKRPCPKASTSKVFDVEYTDETMNKNIHTVSVL